MIYFPNILAIVTLFLLGYLSIRLVFISFKEELKLSDLFLHVLFSLPIGMGISSFISFYLLAIIGKVNYYAFFLGYSLLIIILFLINSKKRKMINDYFCIKKIRLKKSNIFFITLILLYFLFLISPYLIKYHRGTWDAFSCWNLRPRFILYSDNWLKAFSPNMFAVEYPILLPLVVLFGWIANLKDVWFWPMAIAIIYGISLILILLISIARYCDIKKACLLTLFFVNIHSLSFILTSQGADMALSCYNFIAAICFFIFLKEKRRDFLVIGEAATAFSLFTKQEGLLFFLCVNLILWIILFKKQKLLRFFYKSLSIPIFSFFTIKLLRNFINPGIHSFSVAELSYFGVKVMQFLNFVLKDFIKFTQLSLTLYILLLFFVTFYDKIFVKTRVLISAIAITVLFGYFLVFLLRIGYSLEQLKFGYDRLLMHVMPLFCFLIADVLFNKEISTK